VCTYVRTIAAMPGYELEVRKSRFIGHAFRVNDEDVATLKISRTSDAHMGGHTIALPGAMVPTAGPSVPIDDREKSSGTAVSDARGVLISAQPVVCWWS
jgi:putative IMPACT (imprinted ancient) family translation regulator